MLDVGVCHSNNARTQKMEASGSVGLREGLGNESSSVKTTVQANIIGVWRRGGCALSDWFRRPWREVVQEDEQDPTIQL